MLHYQSITCITLGLSEVRNRMQSLLNKLNVTDRTNNPISSSLHSES